MLYSSFLFEGKLFSKLTKAVKIFIVLIIIWIIISAFSKVPLSFISNNLRLLTWLAAILFFYKHSGTKNHVNQRWIKVYIVTFIISAGKKIFEGGVFEGDYLNTGDIAGLTLAICVPAILLFFKGNLRNILLICVALLILATLRRTAIISLVVCFPFVFKEVKKEFNIGQYLLFVLSLTAVGYIGWQYFGEKIVDRFSFLLRGDESYSYSNSYGSGRNIFYMIILTSWAKSGYIQEIVGHGLSSVNDLLKAEYVEISHAHNDILEMLYVFGIIGVFCYSYMCYQLIKLRKYLKKYLNKYTNTYNVCLISFIIIALISGTLYKFEMIIFSLVIGSLASKIENARRFKIVLNKISRHQKLNGNAIAVEENVEL
jgi:hypothetical protein